MIILLVWIAIVLAAVFVLAKFSQNLQTMSIVFGVALGVSRCSAT